MYQHLRRTMIEVNASESFPSLKILTDAEGQKSAQRLFHRHISTDNFSKYPAFLHRLDELLLKFGADKNLDKSNVKKVDQDNNNNNNDIDD